MAMKKTQSGFALLVAIIFMSVMLTFGLSLASLSYKQQVLASNAIQSQYAFYVADAALECALYADQQLNLFAYANQGAPGSLNCDGIPVTIGSSAFGPQCFNTAGCLNVWVSSTRLSLDSGKHCADISVYKPAPGPATTYIFSQGYDVSCATVAASGGARFAARGLKVHY
jgi:hypothetical protein